MRGRGDSPWAPRGRERGAVYTCSGPPSYSDAPREIGASWLQALGVLGRVGKLRLLPGTLGALRPESSPSTVHMTAAADGQRGVGCDWQGAEGTGEGDFFLGEMGIWIAITSPDTQGLLLLQGAVLRDRTQRLAFANI